MFKSYLVLSLVLFLKFSGQKCTNFIQNIDAVGQFNIFTVDEHKYLRDIKNSVQILEPKKNNNQISLSDFQKQFPKIYDGKCIKINDIISAPANHKLCDKNQKKYINEENITFGSFSIESYLDEFYIIKFSGFEIGGFLLFNTENKKMYVFDFDPKFSIDKKYIFGSSQDYQGFSLQVKELANDRSLRYTLNGTYILNNIKLIQYENLHFQLLIDLNETISIFDSINDVIKKSNCNLKIGIN